MKSDALSTSVLYISIAISLFLPSAAWPMVVSDPTSYSYYIEQIKQASEALKSAQQTVDGVKATVSSVTGIYNRGRGIVEDLKRTEDGLRSTNGVLTRVGMGQGMKPGNDGFIDIDKVINGTYGDSRTRGGLQGADARHKVQQEALKVVINDSEKLLQGVADRIAKVKELAAQIDTTANVKDSADLGNRIAIEILKTLVDLLAVAAKSNQAQALYNYSGVTDAGIQERENILKGAQQKMPEVGNILKTSNNQDWLLMKVGK